MFKKLVLWLVVALAILAVVIAFQPADYHVERSVTIQAPAAVIFSEVNDFHKWQEFSPWAKLDPAAKYTFDGPSTGRGSTLAWEGNSKVGAGRMVIIDSRPNQLVTFRLEFIKPFASVATSDFAFKEGTGTTTVTWGMSGKNNFLGKAFCLFVSMDKTVGGDFERGLATLKGLSETAARNAAH